MTSLAPEREAPEELDQHEDELAKRVLRKIDWRLIPLMFITYNLNFMDKTILSSASVFGLREDTVGFPSSSAQGNQLKYHSISKGSSTLGSPVSSTSATSSGNTRQPSSLRASPWQDTLLPTPSFGGSLWLSRQLAATMAA